MAHAGFSVTIDDVLHKSPPRAVRSEVGESVGAGEFTEFGAWGDGKHSLDAPKPAASSSTPALIFAAHPELAAEQVPPQMKRGPRERHLAFRRLACSEHLVEDDSPEVERGAAALLDGEEKVLRRIKRRARREARLKALDAEERERQALRKQIEGLRKKRRELLEQRASLLARVRELQGFG